MVTHKSIQPWFAAINRLWQRVLASGWASRSWLIKAIIVSTLIMREVLSLFMVPVTLPPASQSKNIFIALNMCFSDHVLPWDLWTVNTGGISIWNDAMIADQAGECLTLSEWSFASWRSSAYTHWSSIAPRSAIIPYMYSYDVGGKCCLAKAVTSSGKWKTYSPILSSPLLLPTV